MARKRKRSKWYGVARGRVPGIYTSYADVLKQTWRFPKIAQKGFQTEREAQEWVSQLGGIVHNPKGISAEQQEYNDMAEIRQIRAQHGREAALRLQQQLQQDSGLNLSGAQLSDAEGLETAPEAATLIPVPTGQLSSTSLLSSENDFPSDYADVARPRTDECQGQSVHPAVSHYPIISRRIHLREMCVLCAIPVEQSIGVPSERTERESSVAASSDSEWSTCESEDEAGDFVNTDTSASIRGKRSRSSSNAPSRSSSPEIRPTKRAFVPNDLRTSRAPSPDVNRHIDGSAPAKDTPAASGASPSPESRPKDALPQSQTNQAPLQIYIDGSALGNGSPWARAGWGVWYEDPHLHHLHRSGRLEGVSQTNNRAELTAAIEALREAPLEVKLILNTDSRYVMKVMDWLPNWKSNGFRKVSGGPVANQDLVLQLEVQMNMRWGNVEWKHVKGHSGIFGNEMAEMLAKQGANKPLLESSP